MAVNPLIALESRAPDIGKTFSNALTSLAAIENIKQARAEAPARSRLLEAQTSAAEAKVPTAQERFNQKELNRFKSVVTGAVQLNALPTDADKLNFARNRRNEIIEQAKTAGTEANTEDTDLYISKLESGDSIGANQLIEKTIAAGRQLGVLDPLKVTAAQKEFAELTKGLPEKEKQKARLIKLGLSPRAVGSAIQTISDKGIADEIGDAEATIGQRKKFGELTGSSRAKAIDAGFDRIIKIDQGLGNLDRAIAALEGGAKTGAIERFFPSIRAASVELNQIRNTLALDVIGSVTFGALSEKELELTKEIALPTGLDEPQLMEHLRSRKEAQEKLRSYFQDQINFLEDGGTVAGFLRAKEREGQTSVIRFDRQGNRIQ